MRMPVRVSVSITVSVSVSVTVTVTVTVTVPRLRLRLRRHTILVSHGDLHTVVDRRDRRRRRGLGEVSVGGGGHCCQAFQAAGGSKAASENATWSVGVWESPIFAWFSSARDLSLHFCA